ncbi:MAG TPA: hypothetical protein VD772_02770, partial [Anseongella sp.]|nr:hypothetical protein [Anseongella sp.]
GYTLQSEGKYFNSARVYISGRNLLTLTGYSGVDPETIQINGLTPGVGSSIGIKEYYPPTRQILLGVQLDF